MCLRSSRLRLSCLCERHLFHCVKPFSSKGAPCFCVPFREQLHVDSRVNSRTCRCRKAAKRATAPSVVAPRADDRRRAPLRSLPPDDVQACSAQEGGGGSAFLKMLSSSFGLVNVSTSVHVICATLTLFDVRHKIAHTAHKKRSQCFSLIAFSTGSRSLACFFDLGCRIAV